MTGLATAAGLRGRRASSSRRRSAATAAPAAPATRPQNNFTIDVPLHRHAARRAIRCSSSSATRPSPSSRPPSLRAAGGILENVDGFEDPTNKFVDPLGAARAVAGDQHHARSGRRRPPRPPVERTGWGGDGGSGSLRRSSGRDRAALSRRPCSAGPASTSASPTAQELHLVEHVPARARPAERAELQPGQRLRRAGATPAEPPFLDPTRGRCNVCHANGGANFMDTGKNRNFDTGTRRAQSGDFTIPFFDGVFLFDGGFGGQGLAAPQRRHAGLHAAQHAAQRVRQRHVQPAAPHRGGGHACPLPHQHLRPVPGRRGHRERRCRSTPRNFFLESPGAQELDARFGAPPTSPPTSTHRALPPRAEHRLQPRHGQAAPARLADARQPLHQSTRGRSRSG